MPPDGCPVSGSPYAAGQPLGGGVIVYAGPAASFIDSSATAGIPWHYALYAYDAAFNYSDGAATSATLPIVLPQDLTPPAAKLAKLAAIKAGKNPYRFKIAYTDFTQIDVASLGHRNLLVTGPRKFKQWARLISRTPAANAARIVATYQLIAPGKTWGTEDNGLYTLWLSAGQLRDTAGNVAPKQKLGILKVNVRAAKSAKSFALARPMIAQAPPSPVFATRTPIPDLLYILELKPNTAV